MYFTASTAPSVSVSSALTSGRSARANSGCVLAPFSVGAARRPRRHTDGFSADAPSKDRWL